MHAAMTHGWMGSFHLEESGLPIMLHRWVHEDVPSEESKGRLHGSVYRHLQELPSAKEYSGAVSVTHSLPQDRDKNSTLSGSYKGSNPSSNFCHKNPFPPSCAPHVPIAKPPSRAPLVMRTSRALRQAARATPPSRGAR
ncbi:hypothetical protein VNO77_08583 [Canavalia gladiata]|uniref:Uncharacterized protein n=1 Tax=Canavalia gladiata TaxID=3824 RepID=A0AAN9ME10_CANGL